MTEQEDVNGKPNNGHACRWFNLPNKLHWVSASTEFSGRGTPAHEASASQGRAWSTAVSSRSTSRCQTLLLLVGLITRQLSTGSAGFKRLSPSSQPQKPLKTGYSGHLTGT